MRRTELALVLAGLLGAGGVADAALASHVTGGGPLASAAEVMMIHAAAVTGLVALRRGDPATFESVGILAIVMALGAAIFGGDITLFSFTGSHLFPMAAPVGGTILIAAWLGLVAVVVIGRLKRGEPPT
ncbi:MAG: DUF423 domain-containing protein [Siculibacillus sp.]